MAGEPHKIRQHRERGRVLALSHLFDPDPEKPGEICEASRVMPLPEGLSSRAEAARELARFLKSDFADVRRLAASALGKMAPEKPAAQTFFLSLADLAANDPHPQVRQYAAKAIGRYAESDMAVFCLDTLKDVARDETAPGYVRTAAAETVAAITEAQRRKESLARHWCSRCRRVIGEEESRESVERWGKPYCRHCSDERELEGKNFEATIEEAKRRRTEGGTAVQSVGEKRIAEFLEREGIAFVYDERFRIAEGEVVRPDFYLPEFDLYIEYFGMDTPDYLARAEKKRILYQRAGKKLISLSFRDDARLIEILREKLSHHFRVGGDGSRASLVPPSPALRNQSPPQDSRNELPSPASRSESPSRAERNERSE